jgi:hypothetical protein
VVPGRLGLPAFRILPYTQARRSRATMANPLRSFRSETIAGKPGVANVPFRRSLWAVAALAFILLTTRAVELGDTQVYANEIVEHIGKSPFGNGNSLWEFGHLLWRPLGWLILTLSSPLIPARTDWTPFMQASFVLIVISVSSALIAIALWYAIAMRVSASRRTVFLIVLAAACSHGVLLYAHSGCAYIPGLTCLTASLYFLLGRRTIAGAAFFALSALIWFPFILAGAALLLLAACPAADWSEPLKDSFAQFDRAAAIRFLSLSAAIVVLVYGLALWARQISSVKEALNWYSAANHGFSQSGKLVRMATGLPRSFLYLGKDGILYKRFLRHDPYSPVTLRELARASLWKLVAFYLFMVCLLYEMLRRPRPGWLLLVFAAVSVPVLFFAVVILEPGAPERYLPVLPFLVVSIAWALRDFGSRRRLTQFFVAAFLVCVIFTDGYSFAAPRVSAQNSASLARVSDLRSRLADTGLAMVTTNQDNLDETLNRLAFDDINRPAPLPLYDIIEPANIRVLTWRQDLAARTIKVWANGGDVWVSTRVWSLKPQPSWNWVEGDDPRISWADLPRFFTTLNTDAESGGPDGFLRLARNDANLALLTRLAASTPTAPHD